MKLNQLTIRKGSSLITTVLVMGVLMTLTLGLSSLVIREIGQTASIVRAGQAYYNAEAGVETALLELNNSLPGYETSKNAADNSYQFVPGSYVAGGKDIDFQYQIRNRGDRYPYFDDNAPIFVEPDHGVPKDALYKDFPEKTYDVLPLNQTVTIPLFVDDCGGGQVRDVKDFMLEYYVDFKIDLEIKNANAMKLSSFDILRWKLYGEPLNTPGKTDAISDFYPAHDLNNANQPVCIGNNWDLDPNCLKPIAELVTDKIGSNVKNGIDSVPGQEIIENQNYFDKWSMARECYQSEAGWYVTGDATIQKSCTIGSFVQSHTKNYLTLTNVINPGIIGVDNPSIRNSKAKIYYRLVAKDSSVCQKAITSDAFKLATYDSNSSTTPLPREYAEISADGFAAGRSVKQSIDVRLKLNSFLPVFNFSLYRTDVNCQKGTGACE